MAAALAGAVGGANRLGRGGSTIREEGDGDGDGPDLERQASAGIVAATEPLLGSAQSASSRPNAASRKQRAWWKKASLPYYLLLAMGWWFNYYRLPEPERPHILSSMMFELCAFVGVVAQGMAVAATMSASFVFGMRRGMFFVVVFTGTMVMVHNVMPEHLDPFYDSIGVGIAAPGQVVGALEDGGLDALDKELGAVWRPTLWGCLWYFDMLMVLQGIVRLTAANWEDLRQAAREQGSQVAVIVTLLCIGFPFVLMPIMVFQSWLKTCPLIQPLWFHLHSCICAVDAYRHHAGPKPKPEQWATLAVLVWYMIALTLDLFGLAQLTGMPFDEGAFLEEVMKKGGLRAEMEDASAAQPGYLAQLRRTTTKLFLPTSEQVNTVNKKRAQLHKLSLEHHGGLPRWPYRLGPVVRENLLESSLELLRKASPQQLLSSAFRVHYEGEEGFDAGGVTRDWYDSLARALAEGSEQREGREVQDMGLASSLLACTTDNTLLPRPSGFSDADGAQAPEEQLKRRWALLGAVGRFLGVAVLQNKPLPLSFGNVLMKLLRQVKVSYRDVRNLDPDFYSHRIALILEEGGLAQANAALGEPLTFMSAPTELMPTQVPLKEGGENIKVTEENKMEYIGLLSEARICNGRRYELQFLISGFHEVIPAQLLQQVDISPSELSLLISGVHTYDLDEWKKYAKQEGDQMILTWFWEALGNFDLEQKARLLQFSTGSSRLPAGGFKDMKPQFKVCITGSEETHLPTAHTCFNQLDVPKYTSLEVLTEKLTQAIASGYEAGFGFV